MHKTFSQLMGFKFSHFVSYPTEWCLRNGNGDGDGVCPDFGDGDIFEYGSRSGNGNLSEEFYQMNRHGNSYNLKDELSFDF
jgi:hypothetical protein